MKKITTKVVLEDRNCEFCGATFTPKRMDSRYCSRACGKKAERARNAEKYQKRASEWYYNNLERARKRRKGYYWKDPEKAREKSRAYRKQNIDRYKEIDAKNHDALRFGGLRSDVLALYENECAWCGSQDRLAVHHRNHNKKDNQIKNLILLCGSCHLKVHDPLSCRWGKPTQFKE